jgi:hypothetical protein
MIRRRAVTGQCPVGPCGTWFGPPSSASRTGWRRRASAPPVGSSSPGLPDWQSRGPFCGIHRHAGEIQPLGPFFAPIDPSLGRVPPAFQTNWPGCVGFQTEAKKVRPEAIARWAGRCAFEGVRAARTNRLLAVAAIALNEIVHRTDVHCRRWARNAVGRRGESDLRARSRRFVKPIRDRPMALS